MGSKDERFCVEVHTWTIYIDPPHMCEEHRIIFTGTLDECLVVAKMVRTPMQKIFNAQREMIMPRDLV